VAVSPRWKELFPSRGGKVNARRGNVCPRPEGKKEQAKSSDPNKRKGGDLGSTLPLLGDERKKKKGAVCCRKDTSSPATRPGELEFLELLGLRERKKAGGHVGRKERAP